MTFESLLDEQRALCKKIKAHGIEAGLSVDPKEDDDFNAAILRGHWLIEALDGLRIDEMRKECPK